MGHPNISLERHPSRCAERAAARSGGCSRRSLIAFAGETAGGMGPDPGFAWPHATSLHFRDHSRKLAALAAKLFGLSAQPTDYRREMPCTSMSSGRINYDELGG
jgi:hypothetical protein